MLENAGKEGITGVRGEGVSSTHDGQEWATAEAHVIQTWWGRAGRLCSLSFPIRTTDEPSLNMMIEIIRKEIATLIQEAFLLACVESTAAFQFEL